MEPGDIQTSSVIIKALIATQTNVQLGEDVNNELFPGFSNQ